MQNCAVKMAVAPCLNIKYEYKRPVASLRDFCCVLRHQVTRWCSIDIWPLGGARVSTPNATRFPCFCSLVSPACWAFLLCSGRRDLFFCHHSVCTPVKVPSFDDDVLTVCFVRAGAGGLRVNHVESIACSKPKKQEYIFDLMIFYKSANVVGGSMIL